MYIGVQGLGLGLGRVNPTHSCLQTEAADDSTSLGKTIIFANTVKRVLFTYT